jgi:hypothetical protein
MNKCNWNCLKIYTDLHTTLAQLKDVDCWSKWTQKRVTHISHVSTDTETFSSVHYNSVFYLHMLTQEPQGKKISQSAESDGKLYTHAGRTDTYKIDCTLHIQVRVKLYNVQNVKKYGKCRITKLKYYPPSLPRRWRVTFRRISNSTNPKQSRLDNCDNVLFRRGKFVQPDILLTDDEIKKIGKGMMHKFLGTEMRNGAQLARMKKKSK